MTPSFDLDEVSRFTTGTVGPKGQRVFFLQVEGERSLATLKMEKQQVAALADYLDQFLEDLPPPDPARVPLDLDLVEPAEALWPVGPIGVAYDERTDRVLLHAEELVAEEDDVPASLRVKVTREQVVAFVHRAREVVAQGRPPCPWCGRPWDPALEWCACHN